MRFFTFITALFFSCGFLYSQTLSADFTASNTSVCLGEAITFTSTSTGSGITVYTWNFGNGETSNSQNPVYIYPSAGTYTVTLAIQNGLGQADAEVKSGYITVNAVPDPKFTVAGSSCTVPIDITYTNTTSPLAENTYSWDFGNGTNSTSAQPTPVNYNAAGSYTVKLKATNTATGCSKTFTQDINISNFQADFTAPTTVCAGSAVQFTDNSSAGANVWLWNGGAAGTSSQQNPTFVFQTAGTYTISLSSMNSVSGCNATVSKTVQVIAATQPDFTASDPSGCSPVTINFQNTSGATGTYTWIFGDGQTFSGQTPPPHIYTGNGSYDVSLAITDANGCVDTLTKTGYVNVSDITAEFSATPIDGCDPIDVVFTDASTTPSSTTSPIVSWNWNLGNGQTSTSATPPTQTYNEGKYDITLIVKTANGCADTVKREEYIKVGTKQQASFTYMPITSCVKTDIEFTNTSIINPSVDTTEIVWDWDFGDENNSSDKNPDHQYSKDTGYFDVQLVVDYRGCKDTMKIDSAIYIKAPLSEYFLQQDLFCNPTFPITVETVDTSKLGIASDLIDVYWKWGDGTQTHIPNADLHDSDKSSTTHQYNNYGSYTIWHIIENHTTGCVDSLDKTVNISSISAGMAFNDSVCKLSDLSIDGSSATSSHPIVDWTYDMGDGGSSSGNPATYAYSTIGAYTISQTVTNSVGCSASKSEGPVIVLELPLADFTVTPITNCAPSAVTIVNSSTKQGNGVNLSSYEWENVNNSSQDVTTNMTSSPDLTFTDAGSNTISLVAVDVFGCKSDPVTKSFELTKPTADFMVNSVVCNDTEIEIVNNSSGAPALTYQWLVDNASVGTGPDFTHQFSDVSNGLSVSHTIGLEVTDGNGCKDTLTVPIKVSLPKPNFGYTGSAASVNQDGSFTCPPVFMEYTDSSTSIGAITGWEWDFHDNGNSSVKQNPDNTFVFPGTYNTGLTVTDEYGCTGTVTKNDILTIHGPQAAPFYVQSTDKCGQIVIFDLGPNSDIATVEWTLGNGVQVSDSSHFVYGFVDPGTYNPSVTIKDASNCEVVFPLDPIVIIPNTVTAHFTYSPTDIEMGNVVTFTDASTSTVSPIDQWTWNIYDEVYSNTTSGSISTAMNIPGYTTVTIVVADQYGCMAQYSEEVFVKPRIELPNVFTPNGDGVNDYFTLDHDIYKEYDIIILNRWGNVVYENQKQEGMVIWDGKVIGGQSCVDGVYFYTFNGLLKDEKTAVKTEGYFHILGVK